VAEPLVIRSLRPVEASEVGRLTLASFDAYGRITGPYRDELADPITRQAGATALFVALLGHEVVGTVTYVLPGDEQWEGRSVAEGDCGFRVLAVDPRLEGRGIGRRLVEHCVTLAQADRRHRMVITSMQWMDRAHELYRRLGFVRRPDLDICFPSGRGYGFALDLSHDAADRFPPPGPVPDPAPWYTEVWGG
jgi:GNAT superfamily N-acetyltransferase